MEEIFPKQPFVERLEFLGSLQQGDQAAHGLHIVLQHSLIKEGEISAIVLGTTETFKELSKVSHLPGPNLKMRSEEHVDEHMKIWSDTALWQTVTNKPSYAPEMSFKVADLTFDNLSIEHHLESSQLKERHLTFFLTGPTTLWTVHQITESSFTGEETHEIRDSVIELEERFPFQIEVKPWYFYDDTQPPAKFQLKTHVLVLNFKTDKPVEELPDERFISEAIAITEDLIQIVSFLSRRWITWYSYKLRTDSILRTFVRTTRECSSEDISYNSAVVARHEARNFLRIAFTNLRNLRKSGVDLRMPLVYFVSGIEAKYVEEQFSVLFLALERIKDLFAIQERMQFTLPNNLFKRLRSSIEELIIEQLRHPDISEESQFRATWVQQKLSELNRPALRTVLLDHLFPKYKVEWRDLYPLGSEFTLTKTRDQLFHSSASTDMHLLIKEKHRLQALVERVILSMLGWTQKSNSPDDWQKQWLSSSQF